MVKKMKLWLLNPQTHKLEEKECKVTLLKHSKNKKEVYYQFNHPFVKENVVGVLSTFLWQYLKAT